MAQKLVVLSGYPCSGKSTLSRFMRDELGYFCLSMDDLRENMYRMTFPEMIEVIGNEDPTSRAFTNEEQYLRGVFQIQKIALLNTGKDVVLDGTFGYNSWRFELLQPSFGILHYDTPLKRYLVMIDVDRNILEERAKKKDRDPETLKLWDSFWENTVDFIYPGENTPKIIRLNNDNLDDMQTMFRTMRSL